jgi:hypothetical protein
MNENEHKRAEKEKRIETEHKLWDTRRQLAKVEGGHVATKCTFI